MYELLVNVLFWTAAGAVGYTAVYLVRCKLEDLREEPKGIKFTKTTYDVAIQRAAKDMRRIYHIYLTVPEGAIGDTAYAMYVRKREFLKAICLRESRERKPHYAGYGQTRSLV